MTNGGEALDPGRPRGCDVLVQGALLIATPDRVVPDAALAILDGRIAAAGPAATVAATWSSDVVLDAEGGIVMPGLVNVHGHSPLVIVRGVAEDLGFAPAYTPRIPQGYSMSAEEAFALACLGLWELLRAGSTTIVDMYRHPDALARAAARLGPRAFVGGRIHDADMRALAHGRWEHDPAVGRETLAETEALIDRWAGRSPRIAPILCPHAPDTCSRALLREIGALARHTGLHVHTHLAQSAAEVARVRDRDGLTPAALLDELGLLGPRLVAAHCIHLDGADMARVGRAGIAVAHAPIGNAAHGDIAPVLDLARGGARIALCTDAKSGDMFEAMRTALAVARIRERGLPVRATDVLGWATAGGADALGMKPGRLEPGDAADLVVLDAWAPNLAPVLSPVGSVVHNGTGANVRHVLVAGEILVRDGRCARADDRGLLRDAQAVAARMWAATGLHLPTDSRWI